MVSDVLAKVPEVCDRIFDIVDLLDDYSSSGPRHVHVRFLGYCFAFGFLSLGGLYMAPVSLTLGCLDIAQRFSPILFRHCLKRVSKYMGG